VSDKLSTFPLPVTGFRLIGLHSFIYHYYSVLRTVSSWLGKKRERKKEREKEEKREKKREKEDSCIASLHWPVE